MTFGDERALNTQQGYCHTTMMVAMEVINRHKISENGGESGESSEGGGISCPKCQGQGGLNCFGEPCKVRYSCGLCGFKV
jgi:hypothetical protein